MKKRLFPLFVFAVLFTACDKPNVEEPPVREFTFAVSNITSTGAVVEVSSTVPHYFYFDIASTVDIEALGGLENYSQALLDYLIDDYEFGDYEADGSTFAELYLSYKTDTYDFSGYLNPNTNYTVIAFSVDSITNTLLGHFDSTPFTTPEAKPSSNTFNLVTTETGFTMEATNEDTYYFTAYLKDTVELYGAQNLWEADVDLLDMYGFLSWVTVSGDEEWLYCEYLGDAGDYVFIVAGLEGNARTTDIFTFELTVTDEQYAAGGCENYEEDYGVPAKKALRSRQPSPCKPLKTKR